MPCPIYFLISCSYLPICRLPLPYSSILKCFLLLHSGRPNLVTFLLHLSRSCRVTWKGISMSQLGSPAWQLWQSHRAHTPAIAINSFFPFTPWMEMGSLYLAPLYNSYVFLFPAYIFSISSSFFFCPIHWPHSSSSCPHWQGNLHSEVFPTSTSSSVVSKEKIPWTRGTWRNHSLSRIPQRESSGYCHIPGRCSGTEARWGCGTARKQSVESRSALLSGPAAHTDCKKSKPDQRVQSWRKVRANTRKKYYRNVMCVKEDMV